MTYLEQVLARLRDLGPRLVADLPLADFGAAIACVLAGLVLAKLSYVVLVALLELIRFDSLARRLALQDLLPAETRETPSRLVGRVMYWSVLAFFLAAGIDVLQIIDVALVLEGFMGLAARLFSFGIVLLIGDLAGRLGGAVAGGLLGLVHHPAAASARRPAHVLILSGVAATNLDVVGITSSTPGGLLIMVCGAALATFLLGAKLLAQLRLCATGRRLRERFRIGDRIAGTDGRVAVVRQIRADHLVVASDNEEWLLPAAHVLDAAIRRDEL